MILEKVERRILGAIRLVNAIDRLPITRRMSIESEGLRLIHNAHGDYVILDAPTLVEHIRAFERPPEVPPLQSVRIPLNISDPAGEFLPQRFILKLPRDPDPEKTDSIFQPAHIPLYLSPTARPEISWVVMHATVREETSLDRLPWTFIQILKSSDDSLLATGMADARGEALLVVAGILFAMPSDDTETTVTKEIEVQLKAHFDTGKVKKVTDLDLVQARPDPNPDYLPDPDLLAALPSRSIQFQKRGVTSPTSTVKIAAGQRLVADLLVKLS